MSSSKLDVVLHTQGISKSYCSLAALTDLSFEVGAGEIVGLLGPSAHSLQPGALRPCTAFAFA